MICVIKTCIKCYIYIYNTQYEILNLFLRIYVNNAKPASQFMASFKFYLTQITNKHALMRFCRIINVYGETYRIACQNSKFS